MRREKDSLVREKHLQESVQLAAGMNADGEIEPEYVERARACLARFANELAADRPAIAAAVATGILRRAGNAEKVLRHAADTLRVPVHVLSGEDEALLTYVGVVLTFEPVDGNRLVIDIGGASTEVVIGRRYTVVWRESTDLGCIPLTRHYFSGRDITADTFATAERELRHALQPLADVLHRSGWCEAVGTGGTIMAAGAIMQVQRMCGSAISSKSLERLKNAIIERPLDEIGKDIATPERLAILPGGVALLTAIIDACGIERLRMSPSALREGVLAMLARGELPGAAVIQPDR